MPNETNEPRPPRIFLVGATPSAAQLAALRAGCRPNWPDSHMTGPDGSTVWIARKAGDLAHSTAMGDSLVCLPGWSGADPDLTAAIRAKWPAWLIGIMATEDARRLPPASPDSGSAVDSYSALARAALAAISDKLPPPAAKPHMEAGPTETVLLFGATPEKARLGALQAGWISTNDPGILFSPEGTRARIVRKADDFTRRATVVTVPGWSSAKTELLAAMAAVSRPRRFRKAMEADRRCTGS